MYLIKFICFFRYIPRSKIGVATVENGHFSKLKVELLKSTFLSVLKKKTHILKGKQKDEVREKIGIKSGIKSLEGCCNYLGKR